MQSNGPLQTSPFQVHSRSIPNPFHPYPRLIPPHSRSIDQPFYGIRACDRFFFLNQVINCLHYSYKSILSHRMGELYKIQEPIYIYNLLYIIIEKIEWEKFTGGTGGWRGGSGGLPQMYSGKS